MCLPNILFPVFMFAFIFHCRSFSPCWPLAFLFVSQPLWISCISFYKICLFSITRSSSFSVIHVSVNINNNVEKDTTLLLCFSFLKSRRPCDFFLNKTTGGPDNCPDVVCVNILTFTWTKWEKSSKLPWTKIVQKSKYNKRKLRYL